MSDFENVGRCSRSGPYQGELPDEGELLFERVDGERRFTVLRWCLDGVQHLWRLPYYLDGPIPPVERDDG